MIINCRLGFVAERTKDLIILCLGQVLSWWSGNHTRALASQMSGPANLGICKILMNKQKNKISIKPTPLVLPVFPSFCYGPGSVVFGALKQQSWNLNVLFDVFLFLSFLRISSHKMYLLGAKSSISLIWSSLIFEALSPSFYTWIKC